MARMLFLGLADQNPRSEHRRLRDAVQSLGHSVVSNESTVLSAVSAVFCDFDSPEYRLIVRSIHALRPNLPIIAVTMQGCQEKHRDAIEAGASACCCAPFEKERISLILNRISWPEPNRLTLHTRCHAA